MLEGGRVGPDGPEDVPEDVFLACHLDLSLCGALLLEAVSLYGMA